MICEMNEQQEAIIVGWSYSGKCSRLDALSEVGRI